MACWDVLDTLYKTKDTETYQTYAEGIQKKNLEIIKHKEANTSVLTVCRTRERGVKFKMVYTKLAQTFSCLYLYYEEPKARICTIVLAKLDLYVIHALMLN